MVYFSLNTTSEFVCFLVGLFCLWRDRDPVWRWFVLFLLLTCAVEMTAIHLREVLHRSNTELYNVSVWMECGFTSYFFYHLFKPYGAKLKWLLVWFGVFAAIYLTERVKYHFHGFVSMTVTLMAVVFVLASLLFYYLKLKSKRFEPLLSSAAFWWVNGTLMFYFGSTICNLSFDLLVNYEVGHFSQSVRYLIFTLLDIIFYSFWCYSFICRYYQKKYYPSLA